MHSGAVDRPSEPNGKVGLLPLVSWQQHHAGSLVGEQPFHGRREKLVAFLMVIVRFGRGRTNRRDDVGAGNAQCRRQCRVGRERRCVHILLDAWIAQHAVETVAR